MNSVHDNTGEILTASLSKLMWKLSLPSVAAMLLWGMNTITDAVFVGKLLGAQALAGVALAIPYTAIALGIGQWIGGGAANILSNALGAKDRVTQRKILPAVTILSIISSLLITFPLCYFAEDLLQLMGADRAVLGYGLDYLKITSLGSFFWIYSMALNLVVRGEGRIKHSAAMIGICLIINTIMTPILISVFDLGTAGAAWAINTGMFCLCAIQLFYFSSGKASFSAKPYAPAYDRSIAIQMVKVGLPGFIYTIMSLIQSIIIFNVLTNQSSPKQIAVYAAINTMTLFLTTPLFGLMQAFQPIAGINFGAGKFDRVSKAYRIFVFNGVLLLFPFWAAMMLYPSEMLGLILSGDSSPKESYYFRLLLSTIPLLPFLLVSLSLLPALRRGSYATYVVLLRQLVLFVPIMIILPKYCGIQGIYLGNLIINILSAVVMAFFVTRTFNELRKKNDR